MRSVVALGGGRGLASVLRALRRLHDGAPHLEPVALVSVADDGGSTGRLRAELDLPAPGDVRKCLVALAEDACWADAFEHRFATGGLAGHSLGNLVLAGLAEHLGTFEGAVATAARLLRTCGTVLPATSTSVTLIGTLADGREVRGQVAVQQAEGRIVRVRLEPPARAPETAPRAIRDADLVLLAPGSLYTSVLPVLCVEGVAAAVAATAATVVQVGNLGPQVPETAGLDAADHVRAVQDHGGRVDAYLHAADSALALDEGALAAAGVGVLRAGPLGAPDGRTHDPARLAAALAALLASQAGPVAPETVPGPAAITTGDTDEEGEG